MGGKVFERHSPPIPTPRLTPREYHILREAFLLKLGACYDRVAVPLEGPGKNSYGDVDILVTGPRCAVDRRGRWRSLDEEAATRKRLQKAAEEGENKGSPNAKLQKTKHLILHLDHLDDVTQDDYHQSSQAQIPIITTILKSTQRKADSFAVPRSAHGCPPDDDFPGELYVQVDVKLHTSANFVWEFFMHSHGDLWGMLGPSLRSKGLVLTDRGFCVIHPTIEPTNKKRGRIPLSREPNEVLNFIGLDLDEFWGRNRTELPLAGELVPHRTDDEDVIAPENRLIGRRFTTEDELFAFVCTSRFFDPTAYVRRRDLTANDRKRLAQRGSFRRFIENWVPSRYPDVCGSTEKSNDSDADAGDTAVDSKVEELLPGTTLSVSERSAAAFSPDGEVYDMWAHSGASQARHEERRAIAEEALERFNKKGEWEEREQQFLNERYERLIKNAGRELRNGEERGLERELTAWEEWLKGNLS